MGLPTPNSPKVPANQAADASNRRPGAPSDRPRACGPSKVGVSPVGTMTQAAHPGTVSFLRFSALLPRHHLVPSAPEILSHLPSGPAPAGRGHGRCGRPILRISDLGRCGECVWEFGIGTKRTRLLAPLRLAGASMRSSGCSVPSHMRLGPTWMLAI